MVWRSYSRDRDSPKVLSLDMSQLKVRRSLWRTPWKNVRCLYWAAQPSLWLSIMNLWSVSWEIEISMKSPTPAYSASRKKPYNIPTLSSICLARVMLLPMHCPVTLKANQTHLAASLMPSQKLLWPESWPVLIPYMTTSQWPGIESNRISQGPCLIWSRGACNHGVPRAQTKPTPQTSAILGCTPWIITRGRWHSSWFTCCHPCLPPNRGSSRSSRRPPGCGKHESQGPVQCLLVWNLSSDS